MGTVGTNEAKRTKPDTDIHRALPKDQIERKGVALTVTRRTTFNSVKQDERDSSRHVDADGGRDGDGTSEDQG